MYYRMYYSVGKLARITGICRQCGTNVLVFLYTME